MEEERIARIKQINKAPDVISKKRKASVSSLTSSPTKRSQPKVFPPASILRNEAEESHLGKSANQNTSIGTHHALDMSSSNLTKPDSETHIGTSVVAGKPFKDSKSGGDVSGTGVQFPLGVVKKTWAQETPREDDIKIEEVLQISTLEHAVLGAYQVDTDWLLTKMSPFTKVIWVLQAKTEAEVSRTFLFYIPLSLEAFLDSIAYYFLLVLYFATSTIV